MNLRPFQGDDLATKPTDSHDIEFINCSGSPLKKDASSSRTVRSHVMKRYRKQRRDKPKSKGHLGRYCVPFVTPSIFTLSQSTVHTSTSSKSTALQSATTPWGVPTHSTQNAYSCPILEENEGRTNLTLHEKEIPERAFSPNLLDGNLNPYNYLPIVSSHRVITLLRYSRYYLTK
jgi:hypothetical protein